MCAIERSPGGTGNSSPNTVQLRKAEPFDPSSHQPVPLSGTGVITEPSTCRSVTRTLRDGSAKCWVANEIRPFLAARRAYAHAATRQERPKQMLFVCRKKVSPSHKKC